MPKGIAYSKHNLGYPPWALQFDPLNRPYLLVGGGGGDQKEVPNRLTLLDISARSKIAKAAELDIKSDSVSSLGALATKEGLVAFAGVNSSKDEKEKGLYNHLRSYKVDYPVKGTETKSGKIEQVGQTNLFATSYWSTSDSYQRILRFPARRDKGASKKIGVIVNSLAPEAQLMVFNATTATPGAGDVIQTINPVKRAEANDVDLWEEADGTCSLAYCTQNEIFHTSINYDFDARKPKAPLTEPACLHSAPFPDASDKKARAKYRSLRFIASDTVVLLANLGSQSELQVIRIVANGGPGEIVLRKRLPTHMGQAVSMDTCLLDADQETGARQVVLAVASQKNDVVVFTFDYGGPGVGLKGTFKQFVTLDDAHDAPMKRVALSPFFPPSNSEGKPTPGPQYLRLASISLSNTLVVDSLPLFPSNPKKRGSRYLLAKPARGGSIGQIGGTLMILGFILGITLLLLQSYLQAQDSGSTVQMIPQSWSNALSAYQERAAQLGSPLARKVDTVTHTHAGQKILDLLHTHHRSDSELPDPARKAIILSASAEGHEVSTEVHEDAATVAAGAKRWEDLSQTQQKRWRDKLIKAGAWSADYGEGILKGVFFSELAGAVGRAAVEAMGG